MKAYYVYILICSDNSYYTGITSNLEKRFYEHDQGIDINCYTYNKRPVQIVYIEYFRDPIPAIKREKQIKGWSRKKKEALIQENWDNLIELSKNKQGHPSTGSG